MGRLYQKTVSGETTLALFENGRVKAGLQPNTVMIQYNDCGQIYSAGDGPKPHIIATCDITGNIYSGSGAYGGVLARCIDGKIHRGSDLGTLLARYDGDMFGAAAAAVAVLALNSGIHTRRKLPRFGAADEALAEISALILRKNPSVRIGNQHADTLRDLSRRIKESEENQKTEFKADCGGMNMRV